MRNFAKLVLLFTLSFLFIFLAAAGLRFLFLRVEWARVLPPRPETTFSLFIAAARWALSLALYSSILFSLSYAARKKYFPPMTIISVMLLSLGLCYGASVLLGNLSAVPFSQSAAIPLGDKGVILSNSISRNETSVVLLNGTNDSQGPRVVSIPGEALVFQDAAAGNFNLPPVQFSGDTPWFLKNIAIDLRLNAELFHQKFLDGIFPFLIYAGSVIFLLCSLGFAVKFSAWPLANLFLGILAFRGILALTTFLNSNEIEEILNSFLGGMLPASFAVPLMFVFAGVLLHLYSFLAYIAKRKVKDED